VTENAVAEGAHAPPRRRVIVGALIRTALLMGALIALYFLAPLDGLRVVPVAVSLTVAAVLLIAVGVWEIRAIARSAYPGLRGVQALAVTVPLYLLLFAAAYFAMVLHAPSSFNVDDLTRTDMLYFTVTVFSSVGFGDLYAVSQDARIMVTVQMILNLLVLGAGIRVFIGAVRRRRSGGTPLAPEASGAALDRGPRA
jgi:voltage-gated potassium channel